MRLGRRRRRVVVYTRAGCGLCRTAERLVAAEARGHEVTHVDVDADPDLQLAYNLRVPVVAVDGHEVLEGLVEPGDVRRVLRSRPSGPPTRTVRPDPEDQR